MKLLLLLLVLVCASISLADDTCYNAFNPDAPFTPQPERYMPTCCWYEESTCCRGSEIHVHLHELFEHFQGIMSDAEASTGQPLDDNTRNCFNFMSDFWCLACAPETSRFTHPLEGKDGVHMSLCRSWCDEFDAACGGSQYARSITNGESMCAYMGTLWAEENTFEVVAAEDLRARGVDEDHCFGGVGLAAIESSQCTPFVAGNTAPHSSKHMRTSERVDVLDCQTQILLGVGALVCVMLFLCGVAVALSYSNAMTKRLKRQIREQRMKVPLKEVSTAWD